VNILFLRWSLIVFVLALFTVLSSGCVVSGGGYGYDSGVGIGVDYYEPYGVTYGGWGSGYHVAPFRNGDDRSERDNRSRSPHAYRSAPVSHRIPSIPSGQRSGGFRSHQN